MNKIKISNVNQIDDNDLDDLVKSVYGKPFCFQQQDDCRDRGVITINVKNAIVDDQFKRADVDKIEVNDNYIMGVSFEQWLETDSEYFINKGFKDYESILIWERNFYPDLGVILSDLCKRGHIDEGVYQIKIDW